MFLPHVVCCSDPCLVWKHEYFLGREAGVMETIRIVSSTRAQCAACVQYTGSVPYFSFPFCRYFVLQLQEQKVSSCRQKVIGTCVLNFFVFLLFG
jgi:hypothetical protein